MLPVVFLFRNHIAGEKGERAPEGLFVFHSKGQGEFFFKYGCQ